MYTPAININNKKADLEAIYRARQWRLLSKYTFPPVQNGLTNS